ncbi:efflux RND transporter permease subunit, partial [Escherichia coli]|nr:efflux RND transporter permease subunit [Escherichia coli]
TDVQIEKQVLIPQVRFAIDREAAARYGLPPGEIAETLEMALNGKKVSEIVDAQRRYDLVIRFDDEARASLDALRSVT